MKPFCVWLPFLVTCLAVWPLPTYMEHGDGFLQVSSSIEIEAAGGVKLNNLPNLSSAVKESLKRIKSDKMEILQPDRGANYTRAIKKANTVHTLTLSVAPTCGKAKFLDISGAITLPMEQRDESYTLRIFASGRAELAACNALGLFRGLSSFEQLIYYLASSETLYIKGTPVTIKDKPAYAWRGLLLDTARNFYPVSSLKNLLQTMSYAKFSVFHWHVTDSQSWPLVVESHPELSEKGAYDKSSIYTPHDVHEIISYANAHGIDLVLEIDNPGHTASLAYSHPSLINCFEDDWTIYAAEPQAGQLDITKSGSIKLFQDIYKDVAPRTSSRYFGAGGDELNIACYNKTHGNPEGFEAALRNFVSKTYPVLHNAKKTPLVWQEMVLDYNLGLAGADTLVEVWQTSESAAAVAKLGNPIIHAAANFWYLDCGAGAFVPATTGNSWCDPYKSWQIMYSFDPVANLTTAAEKKLVKGGEAALWSEQSGPEVLDSYLWPRAATLTEVFWTNKKLDATLVLPRLHDFRFRLVQRGIAARPLQPLWCALRPGACDLPSQASEEDLTQWMTDNSASRRDEL